MGLGSLRLWFLIVEAQLVCPPAHIHLVTSCLVLVVVGPDTLEEVQLVLEDHLPLLGNFDLRLRTLGHYICFTLVLLQGRVD